VDHLPHLHDPVNAGLETWVEARRPLAGAEVLAEFRQVVLDRRLAQLRAMTDADMDKVGWSPVGEVPYREFMQVRVFDCWLHEQDMRAGLGQPGHDAGPVVDAALARFIPALGFVVGKKAGAPDGSSVVFEVHGPVARTFPVVVDGRAKVVDTVPADPTVVIGLPLVSLALLGGGRWSLAEAEAAGGLTVEGDEELGRRVLSSMAFTP
jgi:uncharacterized protein (TIGR03083 family)